PRHPDHHAHRPRRGERPGRRPGGRGGRLRGQAVLLARAAGAGAGGAAARAPGRRGRQRLGRRPAHRRRGPPRVRRRSPGADRPHRVPPAALLHDPPGPGVQPCPAAGPRLGRQRVRGGAHDRRAHPPPAADSGAVRRRGHGADGARRRLPFLGLGLIPARMDSRTGPFPPAGAPRFPDPESALPADAGAREDAARLRQAWRRTLAGTVLVLAGAVVGGFASGHPGAVLAAVALALLAWHGWRLHRVLAALDRRQHREPPSGGGAWNALDRLLHRNQAGMRARNRRLLDMLQAYRAAAAALPDAVLVVDRNTQRILWFNRAATALLGLQHPRDLGAPVAARLRPLPMARWMAAGRNAEPILDAPSPVDPGLRLNLRLIPYSEDY